MLLSTKGKIAACQSKEVAILHECNAECRLILVRRMNRAHIAALLIALFAQAASSPISVSFHELVVML
jgi:hypothetical protein